MGALDENAFEAARYANAAAAISVTRHGGSSAPSDAEVVAFLAARPHPEADEKVARKITA